ncbi:hypothetical protein RvY_16271 [Ramazzottius varieornatus]|uniref:Uncharacterized protein n=1 Tax=Ramazzottius varieornatus TaxID=947166 RepID=A0A1D1VYS0_RAMVA|nr:hypothetical protein RvY_16271 [Ramazzottius varieornatus]
MIPWKNEKELVWDVTVVDALAKSYVGKTSEKVRAAAEDAEERKIQKYQGIASQYLFVPLGFETSGSWGPAATELINAIGKKLVEFSFETRSLRYFKQRWSLDIQRGNAFCAMGTAKETKGLEEIFYVLNLGKGRTVST